MSAALWSVPTLNDDLTIDDWLGRPCLDCRGTGENDSHDSRRACQHCGGTGEDYGFICYAPIVGEIPERKQA